MSDVPDKRYFSRISGKYGFKADSLEKVYRLLTVLDRMNGIQELQDKLALKGGTAIQGLIFNFRRLSIDIDLNYTGSVDKDKMQEDRRSISNDLSYLFRDLSYRADIPPSKYALDEFNLHYTNCFGGKDRIKLEINFLERLPIAGLIDGSMSHPFEDMGKITVRSYRPEELFAGKMRALIVRGSPRDVFDAAQIANSADTMDMILFKKLALFYLSMHSGDVRKMDAESVNRVTKKDIENSLVPLLSRNEDLDFDEMKVDAYELGYTILDLDDSEREYFDRLYDDGEIHQELLFAGMQVTKNISNHPALIWRLRPIG